MNDTPFTLEYHQVPAPPYGSKSWADWLRWLIVVMNPDDPQLHFAASLLSHSLKTGGLSEKQAAAANRTIQRVHDAFEAVDLLCLKSGRPAAAVVPTGPRLAIDNTARPPEETEVHRG